MRRFVARLTAQTRDDRGVALFAAIAGMVLLSTMIAALVILARNENLIAQLNKDEAQAAYAAEAGANWGRRLLLQRLSVDLPTRVVATAARRMSAALKTTLPHLRGAVHPRLRDPRERAHVRRLQRLCAIRSTARVQRRHDQADHRRPAERPDDDLPGDGRLSGRTWRSRRG